MKRDLKTELQSIMRGEVETDEAALLRASIDTSLYLVRPQAVVHPKDTDDLKALVVYAGDRYKDGDPISLTARAAGTDMTGGPLGEGIIVDFTKHFTKISAVSKDAATAEPGVFYRDFDRATRAVGAIMPSYPASRELCTIGGMVANNAGGEKTLSYGKTADYVQELSVVLKDGNEYAIRPLTLAELEEKKRLEGFEGHFYREMHELLTENKELIAAAKPDVSKNSSGYALWDILDERRGVFDLTRLFTGSQGTLGLTTKITFRLVPPKEHSRLLVIFLKEMEPLAELTEELLSHKPESLESYDDHTFTVAIRLFPQIVRRLKGNIFGLAFRFIPEFLAVLTGGVPKLVLLAEFTGESEEEALRKAEEAHRGIARFGIRSRVTKNARDAEKYWTFRRESFNLLRQKMRTLRTAPFIEDIIVRPEVLPEFLPKLYAILDEYPLIYTIAGHVGDGNFHIIPLMNLRDPKSEEIIKTLIAKVHQLVFSYHGSASAEHNDGILRTPYLKDMFGGDMYALFEKTKAIFDPEGMFNPHKKTGDGTAFADAHLDRTH